MLIPILIEVMGEPGLPNEVVGGDGVGALTGVPGVPGVSPLLPGGHMMAGPGQGWPGTPQYQQQGFGGSSGPGTPHTYPYMYGYRYPHYENSPYWYRGYPGQTSDSSEPEVASPPQPPAIYPWMRETKSSRSAQFSSSSSFAQASSSSDKSESQSGECEG